MSEQAAQDRSTQLTKTPFKVALTGAFIPTDLDQVWRLAIMFSKAEHMVPADYRGKPEAVATAILWGMELGLSPINAVQGICNIKGRAALWGDHLKAVAMSHPDYVDCIEELLFDTNTPPDKPAAEIGYRVTAKRKGRADVVRQFTIFDAAKAGLITRANGEGPWAKFQVRQCMFRARSWALRDQFPDALRGIYSADEAIDIPEQVVVTGQHSVVEPLEPVEMNDVDPAGTGNSGQADMPAPVEAAPDASGASGNGATSAAAETPVSQPAAGAKQADEGKDTPPVLKIDLPGGPMKVLNNKLLDAKMTRDQLLQGLGCNITLANINEAFAYIKTKEQGK